MSTQRLVAQVFTGVLFVRVKRPSAGERMNRLYTLSVRWNTYSATKRNSLIRVTTQIQLKHAEWEEETKKQSLL